MRGFLLASWLLITLALPMLLQEGRLLAAGVRCDPYLYCGAAGWWYMYYTLLMLLQGWVTGDSVREEWREYCDHVREDVRSGMKV